MNSDNKDNIFDRLKTESDEYTKALFLETCIEKAKNGEKFGLTNEDTMTEVHCALGLPYWSIPVFGGIMTAMPQAFDLIDKSKEMGIGSMGCTGVKMGMYMLEAGMIPKPTMLVIGNTPCDIVSSMSELINNYKPWADVPKFFMSAPHDKSEESMVYFGKQIREAAAFLEEISGIKLDMDKLRQISEEANKQCQLMLELQVLKSAVPTPIDWTWGRTATRISRWGPRIGDPIITDWLERLVSATEKRVKEKKGIDGITEKIRFMWYDMIPTMGDKLFTRLAKELGAVEMSDYYNWGGPWTPIDTSSEEAMFTSFAKRYLNDVPMAKHAMGTLQTFTDDIFRIYKELKCDAVVMGLNIGHKEQNAMHGAVQDIVRERGIPIIQIGCDLWDERYMSADQVFDKIKTFFEVSGLLT
ncbi:MAG: 2-hydroxyacyl-CoA dehydratase family protein [Ignavibacteriae bacterium]|jgi:benzoyl-CoA reductase/2-hydroxyglutaryl-CoA dehydratase subunit BcrC/BadD/HgdB|nr:2-hydroxyacyl-CoA dehydratase family protein [Ignavibacteriota bacterium]